MNVPEGEENRKVIENRFSEITAENFPSFGKDRDIQGQEAQGTHNRFDQKILWLNCQR